ncbi:MAG: hypothetical protein H6713_41495 [Myxococcales bacterium]|nr:hypothetical protein [Myxococcales bacterium]MCB9756438.1 hypothetical protein [Myxococcales bacterium]
MTPRDATREPRPRAGARLLSAALLVSALSCGEPSAGARYDGDDGRVVFVTSGVYTGELGGLAGADALCQRVADEAGIAGTFAAWLSGPEEAASARLRPASSPYVLVDRTIVADDWGDLVDGALRVPIELDELGATEHGDVWTGTLIDGATSPDGDCDGFRSASASLRGLCGSAASDEAAWTENSLPRCTTRLHLYCVQQ